MSETLKSLFDEIVATLQEELQSREGPDPLTYVDEEVGRWSRAQEDDAEVWLTLVLMMLRFGFKRFEYTHEKQGLIREKLGSFEVLAEMDEKAKRALAADEDLGLNLQQIRSVAKNARTAVMLREDFGSLTDLVGSFESDADLAAGMEEMFSYLDENATREFARQVGARPVGKDAAVRRVLSRMKDLVDGSLDIEGIRTAIADMAKATGRSPEQIDYLLEIFGAGEPQIGLSAICAVKSACFRCKVSDAHCAERRFAYGSSQEILHEEEL